MFQFCHLLLNLDFLITLLEYLYSISSFFFTSVKRSEINNFILDHQIDVFFIVETWLKGDGDEAKIADLTPSGYATRSFPRANRGGGLAIIARSHILQNIAFKSSVGFEHNSFELFQATLSLEKKSVNFFCLYRPPPNRKNKLTDSLFVEQLSAFLEYCNSITGCLLILGDFNFHFDRPTDQHMSKILDVLKIFNLAQSVNLPPHTWAYTRLDHIPS